MSAAPGFIDGIWGILDRLSSPARMVAICRGRAKRLRIRARVVATRGRFDAAERKRNRAEWWEDQAEVWIEILRAGHGGK